MHMIIEVNEDASAHVFTYAAFYLNWTYIHESDGKQLFKVVWCF